MGITYVVGDATQPLDNGEANCPCILMDEPVCPGYATTFCYHFTGEGTCALCGGTGIMLATLLEEHRALVKISQRTVEERRMPKPEYKERGGVF